MEQRKKKPFETAHLEVTIFPDADVISTSGVEGYPDWFENSGEKSVRDANS